MYRELKDAGERAVGNVEIFTQEGETLVAQGAEFGLQGQYSLDMPQKTLKVVAKAKYGAKYFDAKLFPDREFTQYKSFVLRNSGNDCVWTRLIDGLQSRLVDLLDTTVVHQAWNPVVVYINGVYWGHYNMRERADRYMIAQHEGRTLEEADNIDIIEFSTTTAYGSNKEWKEFLAYVKTLSPGKNAEDLQYILERVDVENYFEYTAIEMFFGNSDPGNVRFYKLHGEGQKWKWLFYDADYGLFSSSFNSPRSYLKASGMGDQKAGNALLLKLLENAQMQDLFLRKLGTIFQTLTSDVMRAKLDELVAILEPEMPMHFARWAEFNLKAINVESPTTPDGALRYWRQRINRLQNTIAWRPYVLYGLVQEQFKLSNAQMIDYFGQRPPSNGYGE